MAGGTEAGSGAGAPDSRRIQNHAAFIWSVADLLRGDYKQSEYGRVILPFTVLRRLDCVLAPVKAEMLAKHESLQGRVENFGPVLDALTDIDGLWNTSPFDLPKLLDDPDNLADNLRAYIHGFSPQARDILDKFDFPTQITRLDRSKLLYLVVSRFAELDVGPDRVSNLEMGYLYEDLLRPRYLLFCLRAMRADLLGRLATGSTHKTIYMPDIQGLRVPLPSIAEQDRIIDWLSARLNKAHEVSDRLRQQIDLLVEHRQALITAAVTGELEISGAA